MRRAHPSGAALRLAPPTRCHSPWSLPRGRPPASSAARRVSGGALHLRRAPACGSGCQPSPPRPAAAAPASRCNPRSAAAPSRRGPSRAALTPNAWPRPPGRPPRACRSARAVGPCGVGEVCPASRRAPSGGGAEGAAPPPGSCSGATRSEPGVRDRRRSGFCYSTCAFAGLHPCRSLRALFSRRPPAGSEGDPLCSGTGPQLVRSRWPSLVRSRDSHPPRLR